MATQPEKKTQKKLWMPAMKAYDFTTLNAPSMMFTFLQDDFLDCFGDPAVTGKIGTDIEDNKCSWLVVQCLKRASAEQRRVLEENYGQNDPDKVARVKQLYEELDLKAVYQHYEETSYQRLLGLVSQHAVRLPSQIFLGLAQLIYKRQK